MGTRIRLAVVIVPLALVAVVALAALSYVATRATITAGSVFAAPGTRDGGDAFVVGWSTGTDIAIVVSFTPSRDARIRSVTLEGLDPKNAFIETSEYGSWDGRTPLPSFSSTADALPATIHPKPFTGSFTAPAHSQIIVRLLVRAIADVKVTETLTGVRIDAESFSWAHSTVIPFEQPVKLERPR